MAWSEELRDIRAELGRWDVPVAAILFAVLILLAWAIFGPTPAEAQTVLL